VADQELLYRVERLEALLAQQALEADKVRLFLRAVPDGSVSLESSRKYAILGSKLTVQMASNAYWDGANWNRHDTTTAAMALVVDNASGLLSLLTAAAGANPIAWTTTSLSPADLSRLHGWPIVRLSTVETTDIASGTAITLNTWTTVVSKPFNVNSASSLLLITVRGNILGPTVAAAEISSRASIDSAAQVAKLGGGISPNVASGSANFLAGSSGFLATGLAAGGHTLDVQIRSNTTGTYFLRASSQAEYEHLSITVLELTP